MMRLSSFNIQDKKLVLNFNVLFLKGEKNLLKQRHQQNKDNNFNKHNKKFQAQSPKKSKLNNQSLISSASQRL